MKIMQQTQLSGGHLTTEEFAHQYNIHGETVRRWLRAKRLTGIRAGRGWRIPLSELDRITKEGGI